MPTIDPPTPPDAERTPCPLCDSEEAVVVGTRARFGMNVRNVACARCGLVRVDPRPTQEAMHAYYAGPYRAQYAKVRLPTATGSVGMGEPGYVEARTARHLQQARLALKLGALRPGARVLEIGCRDAETLAAMKARGIETYGVEPGPDEARRAVERGVATFNGPFEELNAASDFGVTGGFDQVQLFHVLEHLHDPRGALETFARWLTPGGRVLVVVPNLGQPYGALEGNFFQNAHLYSFSANTLAGLCRRAGLLPLRVVDGSELMVIAERASAPQEFELSFLDAPEQNGEWVATRLDTYRHLERLRLEILGGRVSMGRLASLTGVLQRPGLPAHVNDTVRELLEFFDRIGAPRAALALANAVIYGPAPTPLVAHCARLVQTLRPATPRAA